MVVTMTMFHKIILYSILCTTIIHAFQPSVDDLKKENILKKYPQCFQGSNRSPIDIDINKVQPVNWSPLKLTTRKRKTTDLEIKKDIFSCSLTSTNESSFEANISGGGLEGEFELKEIQWGNSENFIGRRYGHKFDGASHTAETHFIFAKKGLSLEKAQKKSGAVAIVAVFNNFLLKMQDSRVNRRFDEPMFQNQSNADGFTLNYGIKELFPGDMTSFFRYEGSFSRPPCTSGVIWTIMAEPLYVSITAYSHIFTNRRLLCGEPVQFIDDYMEDLPSHGDRVVYINKPLIVDDVTVNKVIYKQEDQVVSMTLAMLIISILTVTAVYTSYRKWKANQMNKKFENVNNNNM